MTDFNLHIIGGGLAGCEAAKVAANAGLQVALYEMRPSYKTPAHQSGDLAELVCSNSFRSDDADYNAVGLLHAEMRKLGSVIMQAADEHRLPAGSALAVDREAFAAEVTRTIKDHPNITVLNRHIESPKEFGETPTIIAAGPLASDSLSSWISETCGESLAFFDAIAPILYYDSIDFSKVWKQSRYDKGDADYINCPFTRTEYEAFIQALRDGDKTEFKEWEKNTPYFEACLPIEVLAERGLETLRWGAMKPVGLTNPHKDEKSYAIAQLRQDNKLGTLWNIVGFQTKLKHSEQVKIFRTIPGLEKAEFARLGGIHRNSYIRSPQILNENLSLKQKPHIYFAGQITGVEGYVESAAIGIMAGLFASAKIKGSDWTPPPETTSMGALLSHIVKNADPEMFQPMNVNFGLFPEIPAEKKIKGRDKKLKYTQRAHADFALWLKAHDSL